ncbi:MAG: tRNA pseudouridine(55) synthase TruB [Gemmataceae bacterium]|nr:tRNA pseudouridine(55) synthase TruB [Gemmataceae bacterium]
MDGIFLLDKPRGPTSRRALSQFAKSFPKGLRHGHAGTLDPLASGLLLIVTGKATRMIELYQEFPKVYEATIRFGATSQTDDSEGPILPYRDAIFPTRELLLEKLNEMVGVISQVPPIYSAVRIEGQRAYRLARSGKPKVPKSKNITVHQVNLLSHDTSSAKVRWEVSSGTYIRSLARDLGESLGCGAYLEDLIRTSIGPWSIKEALNLEDLPNLEHPSWISLEMSLDQIPKLTLEQSRCKEVLGGKVILLNPTEKGGQSPTGKHLLKSFSDQVLGLVEVSCKQDQGVVVTPWKMFLHVGQLQSQSLPT